MVRLPPLLPGSDTSAWTIGNRGDVAGISAAMEVRLLPRGGKSPCSRFEALGLDLPTVMQQLGVQPPSLPADMQRSSKPRKSTLVS
jgi:hypothetical protein